MMAAGPDDAMTMITFVIPVRHPDNSPDWAMLKERLSQTLRSVSAQRQGGWAGIVVANEGADLPEIPDGFAVERVDFPPNAFYDIAATARETAYDAVRLDKGRRILKGMMARRDSRFYMIVDDDDLVSNRIAGQAGHNPDGNGWTIASGYVWTEGGRLLLQNDEFSHLCGTCHIVRADLYDLPLRFEDASDAYVKSMLGSHIRIEGLLAERGTPLETLPFRGAIYRVGHAGAHSRSRSLWHRLTRTGIVRRPRHFVRMITGLRLLTAARRREFFGEGR